MKITKERLQQIIAEEMQRIYEQETPQGGDESAQADMKGKSAVRKYLKSEFADMVMGAKISSSEAPHFVEMLKLALQIYDQKNVQPAQKERMAKLMATAVGAKT